MFQILVRLVGALILSAQITAQAAPGDLDTAGFGSGFGKVITTIGAGTDFTRALALQADGKLVVAGVCEEGLTDRFCLARYQSDGSLDSTFNGTGKVITAINSFANDIRALAIQPDGKIVAAGSCVNGTDYDYCLARYRPDGGLDTTFNNTGTVTTGVGTMLTGTGGSNDYATAIALQPDGKLVVAGRCDAWNSYHFCIARYLSSGQLDPTFGLSGAGLAPIGNGASEGLAVAVQPDGKILVAGYCFNDVSTYYFCVARISGDGLFDSSFGTGGAVVTQAGGGSNAARAIALQPDGKIIVSGRCLPSGINSFCAARYRPNGSLDPTFGSAGVVNIAAVCGSSGMVLQPDGKLVVVASCDLGTSSFSVARFSAEGTLDPTFGTNGRVFTTVGPASADYSRALALQPDGKIVVAGYCNGDSSYDFCVARYQGGPYGYKNCSLDIDGDGRVLATTDSLIHTRIALGVTGNAVVNGINFSATAARTTWPLIRDYLITQCGISLP